jgi:hypothetical protein
MEMGVEYSFSCLESPVLNFILSQINQVCTFPLSYLNIHFNIIRKLSLKHSK